MFKHSLPSIEQFAAYLDGNLSQSEMCLFSQQAERNSVLQQLLEASSVVDNTLAGFSESDFQLPTEIAGSDFELPVIPTKDISPFVTLRQEPMDNMLVADACTNEDFSMFTDINAENYHTITGELREESSHMMIENDSFGDSEDLFSSPPDDL